jgi:hypothetical protein
MWNVLPLNSSAFVIGTALPFGNAKNLAGWEAGYDRSGLAGGSDARLPSLVISGSRPDEGRVPSVPRGSSLFVGRWTKGDQGYGFSYQLREVFIINANVNGTLRGSINFPFMCRFHERSGATLRTPLSAESRCPDIGIMHVATHAYKTCSSPLHFTGE